MTTSPEKDLPPPLRLGDWNFYFLAKLLLLWKGLAGFHPLENLAFAAVLLVPFTSRFWGRLRALAALPAACALLYYDTWLPPFARVLSQGARLSGFTPAYLLELSGRFIQWPVVALLVLAWAGCRLLSSRIRVGLLVVGAMTVLLFLPQPSRQQTVASAKSPATVETAADATPENLNARMDTARQNFFAQEAKRGVAFTQPGAAALPFDLLILHICSLSWDDLHTTGLENHRLWGKFDITFSQFNSAASYSGPAAIRLLRAPCGQQTHTGLYSPAPANCYLLPALQQAGFEPNLLLNHDGHFDNFLASLPSHGHLKAPPMPVEKLPTVQKSFDGTLLQDDLAVLDQWLKLRQGNPAPRVAAFYNTSSLHDGNTITGSKSGKNSLDSYGGRLQKLLDDLDSFMEKVAASGRRAVVFMVPEHGGAVRGDRMQIAGLREIPSPAITLVPVGIRVIGPGGERRGERVTVTTPASYLAVAQIIARLLENPPYRDGGFLPPEYTAELPQTTLLSENEEITVMRQGEQLYLRQGKDGWTEYTAGN